jgi:hypothetical protein
MLCEANVDLVSVSMGLAHSDVTTTVISLTLRAAQCRRYAAQRGGSGGGGGAVELTKHHLNWYPDIPSLQPLLHLGIVYRLPLRGKAQNLLLIPIGAHAPNSVGPQVMAYQRCSFSSGRMRVKRRT